MFEIYQKNTKNITVILKESNGNKLSFQNGDKVIMIAKRNGKGNAVITKEITNFIDGSAIINLTTEDTDIDHGVYTYSIEYNKASGEIYTLIENTMIIKKSLNK